MGSGLGLSSRRILIGDRLPGHGLSRCGILGPAGAGQPTSSSRCLEGSVALAQLPQAYGQVVQGGQGNPGGPAGTVHDVLGAGLGGVAVDVHDRTDDVQFMRACQLSGQARQPDEQVVELKVVAERLCWSELAVYLQSIGQRVSGHTSLLETLKLTGYLHERLRERANLAGTSFLAVAGGNSDEMKVSLRGAIEHRGGLIVPAEPHKYSRQLVQRSSMSRRLGFRLGK